ncbi:unnamed protein product [Colias eurytheme]|nr:unnamed protein product [Colias eurytheme]
MAVEILKLLTNGRRFGAISKIIPTKKKAARLHRAASGTGGGPAVFAKLTDLEQRVLNLIGVQVIDMQPNLSVGNDPSLVTQQPSQSVELSQHELASPQRASPVPPQVSRAISSPPNIFTEEEIQPSQPWYEPQPGPSIEAQTRAETQFEETGLHTPTRPTSHAHVVRPHTEPTRSGQTTPRRARLTRPRGSPRRRDRPTHTDQAAENFLRAEEFWRKFKIEQHKDYMSMRREQNRIRDSEIRIRDRSF